MKIRLPRAPSSNSKSTPPTRPIVTPRVVDLASQFSPEDLAAVCTQLETQIWLEDPDAFVRERCHEFLWSKQRIIVQSLVHNRKTAVPSCHGAGKSFLAARAAAWWLCVHKPGEAFVVSSAPTGRQVRTILWREIGRIQAKADLPGRTNQTEWMMETAVGHEEIVAFGMKPDDMTPTAFQGIHARYVLVVFDEATGIHPSLWDAADSLIANDQSRFLAIGNPDDPDTEFAKVCKPGSGWFVVPISAFDSPNFTGEKVPSDLKQDLVGYLWVEEKRKKWAPQWRWNSDKTRVESPNGSKIEECSHPFWQSKVLGMFPVISGDGGLIPLSWILAAQQRYPIKPKDSDLWVRKLGVDVGGGSDSSTVALSYGPNVRIVHEDHNPDTMQTCGHVIAAMRDHHAEQVNVDEIGIGKGLADRGKELKHPFQSINVSQSPLTRETDELFVNLRAELYWDLRKACEIGQFAIDPLDEDLAGELLSLRYKRTSSGKIQMESKDEAKRRGFPSPNRADAVMLSRAPKIERIKEVKVHEASWG